VLLQGRLNELAHAASFAGIASVIVLEGVDAAGKGGTIRRIASAIPITNIRVIPVGAPTEEERARHYLWRFWRQIPARGNMVIFDRSWYGRVLVERVEGFATTEQWHRAYEELNDFESMLEQSGIPVIKFWLQIDQDEQQRRFAARAQTPYKKYKLTEEDLRNRSKWDLYQQAANDMLAKTSTSLAPWYVLSSMDKRHARLKALGIVCDRLEARVLAVLGKNWRKHLFQAPGKASRKTGKNGKNGKKG
jgi:polyphosphate kinase 2 (PPK2 family)